MRSFVLCLLQVLMIGCFSQNLPKNTWKIDAVDSEEKNEDVAGSGFAFCLIDNDLNTFWTTAFKTKHTSFPHWVVIDLDGRANLSGFVFHSRQNRTKGKILQYAIFASENKQQWKLIHDGIFNWKTPYDCSPQYVTLRNKTNARYLKLVVLKRVSDQDFSTQLAELDVQGVYTTPVFFPRVQVSKNTVIKNEFAQFFDSSYVYNTQILSREWHFPGGNPVRSSKRNPKVHYTAYGEYDAGLTIRTKEGETKSVVLRKAIKYLPDPEIYRLPWKLVVSDQEVIVGHDTATNMLDNNPLTLWHTAWFQTRKLPHFIIVDLGRETSIHAIGYLPRQHGVNGIFASYKVFVSNDSVDFGKEVCHVIEPRLYKSLRINEFPSTKGRYVKVIIDKTFPVGTNFASASEFYVYGEVEEQSFLLWILMGVLLMALAMVFLFRHTSKKKQNIENTILMLDELVPDVNANIYLFGKFQISYQDKKVVQLFSKLKQIFVLITYHTIENLDLTSTEISRLLWYDLSGRNVTSARSSNINKLRNALEEIPDIQIVVDKQIWTLQTSAHVFVDFKAYREHIVVLTDAVSANQYNKTAIESFLSIIERGRFMDEFETDWADNLKNKISEQIIDLLKALLARFSDRMTRQMKGRMCDCLFLQDELSNDALRLKLQLYLEDSNLGLAKSFYETFSRNYKSVYKEDFPTSFSDTIK